MPPLPSLHRRHFLGLLASASLAALPLPAVADKDLAPSAEIADRLRALVENLRKINPEASLLAFWDFDGTLLKGDCSEGFAENGVVRYKGLVETAIEAGLSRLYPPGSFSTFWSDYQDLDKRFGHWLAYGFLTQIFQGAHRADLEEVAVQHFRNQLKPWFFRDSLHLWKTLRGLDVSCHVISASPRFFVAGAAPLLGIPADHCHGIQLAESRPGILSHEIIAPMTYAEGKAATVENIIARLLAEAEMGSRRRHTGFLPVAAFGNSHSTDGAMLRLAARTRLPAGTPLALMVNGGTCPPENQGLFTEARFEDTASPE